MRGSSSGADSPPSDFRESNRRETDPRTKVTPDAFEISRDLLGLPLAGPWLRLSALVLDGILIAVLSLAGPLLLGIAAAVFFIRMALAKEKTDYLARAFRGLMGCLGLGILFVTGCGLFVSLARDAQDSGDLLPGELVVGEASSGDDDELSVDPGDVFSDSDEMPSSGVSAPGSSALGFMDSLGPSDDLPDRLSDTLASLQARLGEVMADRETTEARLERTRRELEEVRDRGILGWIEDLVDELGLAFGWGAIYMTVFLTWWNGQSPGKRLLKIRVRQLDGTPLTWWEAFERSGGYAAGFATGLLGFLQVFWDPNRQAIHDKIAQTVVVSEGKES